MTDEEQKLVIRYAEQFGDGVPFAMFGSEKEFIKAIKAALEADRPIREPPPGIVY